MEITPWKSANITNQGYFPLTSWLSSNYYHIVPLSVPQSVSNDWSTWGHRGWLLPHLNSGQLWRAIPAQSSHWVLAEAFDVTIWLFSSSLCLILLLSFPHKCCSWKHSHNKLPTDKSPSDKTFFQVTLTGGEPHPTLNWLQSWHLQDLLPLFIYVNFYYETVSSLRSRTVPYLSLYPGAYEEPNGHC